jgi:hypothetical protein
MTATTHGRRLLGAALRTVALLALFAVAMTGGGTGSGEGLLLAAAPGARTAPITINTVPPVANFPVTLDAVTRFTDAAGDAHFEGQPGGLLADRISLTQATLTIGGQQVQAQATRFYQGAGKTRLAINLSYLVTFSFSQGSGGSPVNASFVESITMKSETGEILTLPAHGDAWLLGVRAVSRRAELLPKAVGWRVQNVQYAGTNVVNASQQRFSPAEQSNVDVKLLFYGLDVRARDAFFGFATGNAVDLVYPDGTSRRFSLDDAGRLHIPALPRGDYTLTAVGSGPKMSRPLGVSRDQVVDLAVYSWLDVLIVLAGALVLSGGLASWGRARRRRSRSSTTDEQRTSDRTTHDAAEPEDIAPNASIDPPRHRDSGPIDAAPEGDDGRVAARSRESLESEVVPPRGA